MSTCAIINPKSGSNDEAHELQELLEKRPGTMVRVTERPGHATEIAANALRAGIDLIVAAGGDGTTSEVVSAMADGRSKATLAIVPMGTGNDLPRTLGLPLDPMKAMALIDTGQRRRVDLVRVEYGENANWCINVAAGGFSGEVDEALTAEMKQRWGPLAYLRSAAGVIPDLTRYDTRISYNDGSLERIHALNVIVANARTAAGGLEVAPYANMEDGLLDVVVVEAGSKLDMAGAAARLLTGNYVKSEAVNMRRAQRVRIESHPGMLFNVDGELVTREAVTFEVVPLAIEVIVGADYVTEPAR